MVGMKTKLVLSLLCFSLVFANSALAKTILPDACGDDSVKFDVKTEKNQPAPAPPEAGKAQIVFSGSGDAVIRYGVDGTWVGANNGNSYFVVSVSPGEHHLCAGWQSVFGNKSKKVGMATFVAEAGKVYYYEAAAKASGGGGGFISPATGPGVINGGGGYVRGSPRELFFSLLPLGEDEGKYRIKAWELATFTSEVKKPFTP